MASCNMCRNGRTALGRDCPNGCRIDPTKSVLDRLQLLSDCASIQDQAVIRDAIGLIVAYQDKEAALARMWHDPASQ